MASFATSPVKEQGIEKAGPNSLFWFPSTSLKNSKGITPSAGRSTCLPAGRNVLQGNEIQWVRPLKNTSKIQKG